MDGNSETNYFKGSCTHTQRENKAWWRVDLGQVEPVSEVYIVNRGGDLAYRLDNFEIRVGRLTFSHIALHIITRLHSVQFSNARSTCTFHNTCMVDIVFLWFHCWKTFNNNNNDDDDDYDDDDNNNYNIIIQSKELKQYQV